MAETPAPTSLRIAEFAITHFRTFHERTIIPLYSGERADPLVVFHGDNGAGKSTALAALDLFFRALAAWLQWRVNDSGRNTSLRCPWDRPYGLQRFTPRYRDWPPNVRAPMVIEVRFEQQVLGTCRLQLTQSGLEVLLDVQVSRGGGKTLEHMTEQDYTDLPLEECNTLRSLVETPQGPGSRALFILDEHRRGSWRLDDPYEGESLETLSPLLAQRLHELRLSLDPHERERWRNFVALLSRFSTMKGREPSVDLIKGDSGPELFFEERRRLVLRLEELSSGEQQMVAVCAAIMTSRASIIAIAEPELSLSATNQRLLRDILEQQVREGVVDQLILESHVQVFDGPEVVRFQREGNVSRVARESRAPGAEVLTEQARQRGAEEEYVTAEGYTRLPESMRREMGVEAGGMIWFLKDERQRWAAWKTEELDKLFGLGSDSSKES